MDVSKWQMTEEQFLTEIITLCEQRGIWIVHIDTARKNRRRQNLAGFPDLFLCSLQNAMYVELKKETGRTSPRQTSWRYRLGAAGQHWELWRPSDLESGHIERTLDALNQPPPPGPRPPA